MQSAERCSLDGDSEHRNVEADFKQITASASVRVFVTELKCEFNAAVETHH
jgi:hypothetical protein